MPKKFVFRNNQSIGAANAERDKHFLNSCFIDTGELDILVDCEDPRCIIAGRTGSGKSALIAKIQEREENVIRIRPEDLALTYVSNSGVITFLTEVGVNMDIFYKLLWRHILVVELLKRRFHITEETQNSFLDLLWQLVPRNKKHQQAIDYLKNWGESFWKETEYRVKEVTSKFENELAASVGASIPQGMSLNASGARKLSEEQKAEVIHRAQEVVNKVQIAELTRVIDLLGEVLLKDHQKKFFIIIDKLDEDWVEDRLTDF
jgi:adenylate kinase family enzyme